MNENALLCLLYPYFKKNDNALIRSINLFNKLTGFVKLEEKKLSTTIKLDNKIINTNLVIR